MRSVWVVLLSDSFSAVSCPFPWSNPPRLGWSPAHQLERAKSQVPDSLLSSPISDITLEFEIEEGQQYSQHGNQASAATPGASVFPGELAAKHLLTHHLFVNLQGSRIMPGW